MGGEGRGLGCRGGGWEPGGRLTGSAVVSLDPGGLVLVGWGDCKLGNRPVNTSNMETSARLRMQGKVVLSCQRPDRLTGTGRQTGRLAGRQNFAHR